MILRKPNAQFTGNRLSVNAEFWNGIAKRRTFFAIGHGSKAFKS
jgi:hypothetical protein